MECHSYAQTTGQHITRSIFCWSSSVLLSCQGPGSIPSRGWSCCLMPPAVMYWEYCCTHWLCHHTKVVQSIFKHGHHGGHIANDIFGHNSHFCMYHYAIWYAAGMRFSVQHIICFSVWLDFLKTYDLWFLCTRFSGVTAFSTSLLKLQGLWSCVNDFCYGVP